MWDAEPDRVPYRAPGGRRRVPMARRPHRRAHLLNLALVLRPGAKLWNVFILYSYEFNNLHVMRVHERMYSFTLHSKLCIYVLCYEYVQYRGVLYMYILVHLHSTVQYNTLSIVLKIGVED